MIYANFRLKWKNENSILQKNLGDNMNISEFRQITKVALLVGVIYLLKFLGIVNA